MRFAAIDIGSNAIRLLFVRVIDAGPDSGKEPLFQREFFLRLPIRLGTEVFTYGVIGQERFEQVLKTLEGFKCFIDAFKPTSVMACATSAMRDADNGQALTKRIKDHIGLDVMIIDGKKEAELIFSNHTEDLLSKNKHYLYIDVGGGSTELTLFADGKKNKSASFDIGTVRLLTQTVEPGEWQRMEKWLKKHIEHIELEAIGSGGNISKLHRMAGKKKGSLTLKKIQAQYKKLEKLTPEERMAEYKMKPDRADVIVPAARIYINTLQWANIETIHVPYIGLADGMIRKQYELHRERAIKN